jgi:hypothetical protein
MCGDRHTGALRPVVPVARLDRRAWPPAKKNRLQIARHPQGAPLWPGQTAPLIWLVRKTPHPRRAVLRVRLHEMATQKQCCHKRD